MKWVVLTIIAVLVPYTWLTLHYRKPGHAFEPYHDLKNRANIGRLLAAGYQRIPVDASRPADAVRVSATAAIFAIQPPTSTEYGAPVSSRNPPKNII